MTKIDVKRNLIIIPKSFAANLDIGFPEKFVSTADWIQKSNPTAGELIKGLILPF